MARKPIKPPKRVNVVRKKIHAAMEAAYVGPRRTGPLTRLAALVVFMEEEEGEEAGSNLYWALLGLFNSNNRVERWGKALNTIPADTEKLGRLIHCCRAYRKWVSRKGRGPDLNDASFKLDQVVDVMMQIPKPDTYVSIKVSDGFDRVSSIFHPNTLAYARENQMKGMFGYSEDYDSDYSDQLDKVEVV